MAESQQKGACSEEGISSQKMGREKKQKEELEVSPKGKEVSQSQYRA